MIGNVGFGTIGFDGHSLHIFSSTNMFGNIAHQINGPSESYQTHLLHAKVAGREFRHPKIPSYVINQPSLVLGKIMLKTTTYSQLDWILVPL